MIDNNNDYQPIDNSSILIEQFYTNLDIYFNFPILYKQKDINGFSVYFCRIQNSLNGVYKYLIAFVYSDYLPLNTQKRLTDLKWVSFQTRELNEIINIPNHIYNPRRYPPLNIPINKTTVNNASTDYFVDIYPIKCTVLHTAKKTASDYQQTGSLIQAIETYQTILTLN